MDQNNVFEVARYLAAFMEKVWAVTDDDGMLTENVNTEDDYAYAFQGEFATDVEVLVRGNFCEEFFKF